MDSSSPGPSCSTSSSQSSDTDCKSLLDTLRQPAPSDLARKRRVAVNPPIGAKRRTSQAKVKSEPARISPRQRLLEFKDEPFIISCGKLFCSACREPVSLKKSVIKLHVDCSKHKSSTVKLQKKEAEQRDIVQALKAYEETYPKGETLSDNVHLYRLNIVRSFLKAGVPLTKITSFREF